MKPTCVPREEITDTTLKGAEILAKVFGLGVPWVGALGVLIQAVGDRRTKRQLQRLEQLVRSVIPRLERLEDGQLQPTDPDLLDEILAKAVNDEDERKTQYYAALIEYSMSGNQDPYQVRLLGDAMKSLTAGEIKAFVHFSKHGALRYDIPDELRDIFWDRISTFGLYKRGEKNRAEYITFLGKKFLNVCILAASGSDKLGK